MSLLCNTLFVENKNRYCKIKYAIYDFAYITCPSHNPFNVK